MNLPRAQARERTRHARLALDDAQRARVEQRRGAAIRLGAASGSTAARVATAPPGYVLTQTSSDIIRHSELLEPLPDSGEVRVVLTPGRDPATWHLDVATRDRPGLLAAFTGVFADAAIDVAQAVLATWDDGAALQAFVVRAPELPSSQVIQSALGAALDRPLGAPPVADAHVVCDEHASPLYTACTVTATDRPGLLHGVAVAIAAAGADIHAARVSTVGGVARDAFDLSDRAGHKIGAEIEESIRGNLSDGVDPARSVGRVRAGRTGLGSRVPAWW